LADKHFNVFGRYHFTVTDSILMGGLRPLRDPDAPEELLWAAELSAPKRCAMNCRLTTLRWCISAAGAISSSARYRRESPTLHCARWTGSAVP
jgi:hypothetical protein